MRRSIGSLLAVTVLLSACDLGSPTRSSTAAKRTAAHSPKPTVFASAAPRPSRPPDSASPTPEASARASAAPSASSAPRGPLTTLSGIARIDASYAVSVGAGSIIAAGSGNIIAAGSGNIIAAGSGNVIAAGSGNIIAAGSGNVIAAGSGNIIAAGSGNLIASSNAGIIAAGSLNYRTLNTAPASQGTILPVKGMVVVPISLSTGQPLGPAVVTDDRGNYSVSVPQGQANNVLLLAALPGKDANDPIVQNPRLQYRQLVPADASQSHPIDEDGNVATSYLVTSLTLRLNDILTQDSFTAVQSLITGWSTPDFVRQAVLDGVTILRERAKKDGIDKLSPADQLAFTRNSLGFILGKMKPLDTYSIKHLLYPSYPGPEESATGAMLKILTFMREQGTAAWARAGYDPNYFDERPYVVSANRARASLTPPLPAYHLAKPSDVGEFLVYEYLSKNDANSIANVGTVMADVGATVDPVLGVDEQGRLNIAAISMIVAFISSVAPLPLPIYDQPNILPDVLKYIDDHLLPASGAKP